jgi:hypothetical protein
MKFRYRLARAATLGALVFSGGVIAAQLKENTADIQQVVNIPGMAIAINSGGSGCNAARHEKWEPAQGGCSNIEWVKNTARVVSVTASPPSILANNIDASTLVATVKDGDGYLVGPGIPTSWWTTNGWLSGTSTVTNASGQTAVSLRGTVAGGATVTAAAVAGAASTSVWLNADPSTSRVVSLSPSPATVPADGTASALYATVRDAYNNVLPAGQPVYWAQTLNSLNTGLSYTDGGGVAVATIAGATPGVATIYARTAVSANAATNVTFTSVAPILPEVDGFTVVSRYFKKSYPGTVVIDNTYGAWSLTESTFSWSVRGAVRYVLTSGIFNTVYYSGTGNSVKIGDMNGVPVDYYGGDDIWVLKACSGPDESSCTKRSVQFPTQIVSSESQSG